MTYSTGSSLFYTA